MSSWIGEPDNRPTSCPGVVGGGGGSSNTSSRTWPSVANFRTSFWDSLHFLLPFFIALLVPIIEKHPESCTVQLGKDCKLFCHVIGKNLKYRWYRRSRCLEGEVSKTYFIPKDVIERFKLFSVKVLPEMFSAVNGFE